MKNLAKPRPVAFFWPVIEPTTADRPGCFASS